MGVSYVDLTFRIAADPDALLVYNDCRLEYGSYQGEASRAATLSLLERIKAILSIHALGIQSHSMGDEIHFNTKKFRRFFANLASM